MNEKCDTAPNQDDFGLFAVVAEGADEGPILWETSGRGTSYDAADAQLKRLIGTRYFRGCIVRLEFVTGNEAVLHAMKGCQK